MKSEPSTASRRCKQPSLPARPIGDAITEYQTLQRRRFHVPAHAGFRPPFGTLPEPVYPADLTEVEGLDVLSEPVGCIAESQAMAAERFEVAHSFYLVNGASAGLIAAMLAAVKPGEKVLVPRNVHRSVLSGLILSGATPVWMLPEYLTEWGLWGAVEPEAVHRHLHADPAIKALFLTSPTYEGIGSDIEALAEICHAHQVLLIVDEAHGALWPFSANLPLSACHAHRAMPSPNATVSASEKARGADAVIHSLHKSAGTLTQGALAHLTHGSRIDPENLQQALNIVQTTSPSYLLLRDLEATCAWLGSESFEECFQAHWMRVTGLRRRLTAQLRQFELLTPTRADWDPSRLYFRLPGQSGEDWGPRLEEGVSGDSRLRVAYESASPHGVLYVANLGLRQEDFDAFEHILLAEEARLDSEGASRSHTGASIAVEFASCALPEMAMTPREAFFAVGEDVPAKAAEGRIARETVVHCPPGIPVLIPGELILARHLPFLPATLQVVK